MLIEFNETWFEYDELKNQWSERNVFNYNQLDCEYADYFKLNDESRNIVLYLKKDGSECIFNDTILYKNNQRAKMVHPHVYNPISNIAVVMLYTSNFSIVCCFSEANVVSYCVKHRYTCYIYRDSMVHYDTHPTWNKPLVLMDNIKNHDYIMWIDSDAIFTNFDISIGDIIKKHESKDLMLCNDIGGWKFNAGVQIWKNSEWSMRHLIRWWNMKQVGHMQGGDQVQLIDLLNKYDPSMDHYSISDQTEFNCHPKVHREGMFILHMMGMSGDDRIKAFKHWNMKNGIVS
jgi:hypothetical protein